MGIFFMDSFDDRTGNSALMKWDSSVGGSNSHFGTGRTGASWLCGAFGGDAAQLIKTVGGNLATVYVGFAVKWSGSTAATCLELFDGSTVQVYLKVNSDLTISVVRGGDNVVLGTTTNPISTSTYHYVEFSCTINNSTGAFTLKLDGNVEASGTGIDTQNSANAYCNKYSLGQSAGNSAQFDDVWFADDQFYGALQIFCIKPSGAGDSTQWTPDSGSNYARVNESSPDDDTSYVADGVVGDEDLYQYADLANTGLAVKAVQVWTRHRKDDTAGRAFTPQCKSGATDHSLSSVSPVNGTYNNDVQMQNTDPNTGSAWTAANLNSAQFGFKVTA